MLAPRASGLGALSICSETNRLAPVRRATSGALLERQIAVVVAGHRHPDPAALDELVAKLAGKLQAELLFADFARDADGAGIGSPMTGVDHDDRAAGGLRGAFDAVGNRRRKLDRQAGLPRLADREPRPSRLSRAIRVAAIATPTAATAIIAAPAIAILRCSNRSSTSRPPSAVLPTYHGNMVNRSLYAIWCSTAAFALLRRYARGANRLAPGPGAGDSAAAIQMVPAPRG